MPAPVRVPVVTEGATRRFGEVTAVDDISLSVQEGTILGLIGPSGSGKTTFIRLLTGTLEPTSGTVRVLGENPRHFRRQTRERLGYMPQHFVLYPELTASENVSFVASLFGVLWNRRKQRVRQVLEFVELWDARKRQAKQLSGGMQRRLELACALVHEPSLLFVDEPTAGIDPILRQTIWQEFRRMREEGRTMVVTTQYVAEAEYCDVVAVIASGRLVALADPEDLRRQATGGEMIEIQTDTAWDGSYLVSVPGVRSVRQNGPRHMLVVADEAGVATPRILEAISQQGVNVVSSSEYRPSFDEVFAALLTTERSTEEPHESAAQPIRRAA